MIVLLRHRLAILAMPKTGSTAIEAALAPHADLVASRPPELKHMTLRRFERFLRPLLAAYGAGDAETVCLIREPLDWLGSWYRYRSRPGLADPARRTDSVDFDGFVAAYLSPSPPAFAQVGRQSVFLRPGPRGRGIDHLFRYEAIAAFTDFLADRIGRPLDLPRLNVSPGPRPRISDAMRARAEAELAEDYRLWRSARG